ncbi:MAG: CHAT domain-containing protein [Pseudonocardiaceae bacterium]
MPPPARRCIELTPGTPVANAVTRSEEAFARGDVSGVETAYDEAIGLATGNSALWLALASNHAEKLRALGLVTRALQRCTGYLAQAGTNHLPLWVQRAELRCSLGDHTGAGDDVTEIRRALRSQPDSLTADDLARLHRVEGLSAAERDDADGAARHLDAGREIFEELGNSVGVATIELDKLRRDVQEGDEHAVAGVLSGEPSQTVADYLLRTLALRRQLRYEEAFRLLLFGADQGIDPALHWAVLYELILLLRLLRQDDTAEKLLPLLWDTVVVSADPVAANAAAKRLSAGDAPSDALSPQFDRRVQYARRLIPRTEQDYADQHAVADRLDEAECLLTELRALARADRDIATWHLAAGELDLARYELSAERLYLEDAVGHLSRAVDLASTTALAEVQACALGARGDAFDRLDAHELAVDSWTQAHLLEKSIADRQLTDTVRIGMLLPVPDEHDKRIQVAAKMLGEPGGEATGKAISGTAVGFTVGATADLIVAMEAARGAAILERILPGSADLHRDLPRPRDFFSACQWVNETRARLSPAQVAWIMHSTPGRIHHAVLGREGFFHTSVATGREDLAGAIGELMTCWSSTDEHLEEAIAGGEFDNWLGKIAELAGIGAVVSKLPQDVHRIAIVAGRELSEIPFAALALPDGTGPLGLRYALSDLPCLSARLPLHHRSLQLRGDRRLLVRPPAMGITLAPGRCSGAVLDGERATLPGLRAALELRRHRQIRIDCHGQYDDDDSRQSWLQLAPEGPTGRLRPQDLEQLDLRGCGTLVLGACDSGMSERIGHDERVGFVRAAVHAGAPAVIAARWRAKAAVAATVLDRFDRYVRYLPRDLALQRAQADVCRGAPGVPTGIPAVDHPARWACWTLYGDSGWQTRAGPVRRVLRRSLDQRRRHAAHS